MTMRTETTLFNNRLLSLCTGDAPQKEKILRLECGADAPQKEKSLRPECGAEAPTFLSAVYKRGTQAKKRQAYAPQYGRSMIEMLGVLAIIGVLTIGSITGYSHAMRRHLLNKQREQISYILSAVETHRDMLDISPNSTLPTYLKPIFETFGWIPEEMIRENDNAGIYTIFGNRSSIELSPPLVRHGFYYLSLRINIDHHNAYEQCVNLFQLATKFHTSLWLAEVYGVTVYNRSGDKYCTSANCLRNTTPADIAKFCQVCKDQNRCKFSYHWR